MGTVVIIGESRAEELLSEFPIVKTKDFASVKCTDAVVIMGKNARAEVTSALGVIVDGDEPAADLPRFVQVIACGVSPKNTVSVTSRTTDKITLSLNRSVQTADGVCEPLEQPMPDNGDVSEYDLMAAFAAKILLKQNYPPR